MRTYMTMGWWTSTDDAPRVRRGDGADDHWISFDSLGSIALDEEALRALHRNVGGYIAEMDRERAAEARRARYAAEL